MDKISLSGDPWAGPFFWIERCEAILHDEDRVHGNADLTREVGESIE